MMHQQFFNSLGLREDPFHVSPDPRFYYCTPAHESALSELLFGIETRKGFLVLTGEAGTGKTSLLNQILDWLRRNRRSTAYLFHSHVEPIGLLRLILNDFGVPCQSRSKSELVTALYTWLLQRYAAHDLPVLIIDEAQALPLQTLDELRLLLNLETSRGKLLQIILAGQPELDEKLRLPALRQLRQRIVFHSHLPVLTKEETAAYISRRLAAAGRVDCSLFPHEVVQDIHASSCGIPRVVNLLCEHALISAYAEQQSVVSLEMIHRIAVNFDLRANPLAITDLELQPHFVRLAPSPVIEEPVRPSVAKKRLTPNWCTQIDFGFIEDPHPAVHERSQAAAVEDALPVVPPPAASVEYPRWRNHRSRSVIVKFVRNSVASVQVAWHAFTRQVVGYVRSFSSSTTKDPLPAVREQAQTAAKEDPVPAVPPSPAPVEYPKWRKHRSHSAIVEFVRNSAASVQLAWHAFTLPVVSYVRSVSSSFVRDCRLFFRVLTLPTPALQLDSSPQGPNQKSGAQHNVFAPIVNWLRQPFTPGSGKRSATRPPHRRW
jgi:general secretion pathway protein A